MAASVSTATPPSASGGPIVSPNVLYAGVVALRVYVGLVWLSNGLAKAFDRSNVTWGGFSFSLITRDSAKNIATNAAHHSQVPLISSFYRDTVIPHWSFFSIFLTIAELALGFR